jgi:hypothetical protein
LNREGPAVQCTIGHPWAVSHDKRDTIGQGGRIPLPVRRTIDDQIVTVASPAGQSKARTSLNTAA